MRVLIIYERKNRELENAVLLKCWFESQGHTCKISQFYEASNFVLLFFRKKYDVMIVPHFYGDTSVYRGFSRFGHADYVFNLQYEQVLSKKWSDVGHHNPKGEAKKALHMCWGEETQNRLVNAGLDKNNLPIIPPLHFDLLRSEYRVSASDKKEQLAKVFSLNYSKKWNLFISSFTYADISDDRLKMNENVAGVKLDGLKNVFTDSRDIIVKWFEQALLVDKESLFIYRPHPDELNLEPLKELANQYPNFRIVNALAVKEWIIASDAIYSWYSTSVVEAHFLNKPYAILRPLSIPDYIDSVLIQKADFVTNCEDFLSIYVGEKEIGFAIKDEYINDYYLLGQKEPSFVVLENLFKRLLKKPRQNFKISFSQKLKAIVTTYMVAVFYVLYKISPVNLKKYDDVNLKRNIFIKWFLEFEAQIASKEEVEILEKQLKKIMDL